MDTSRRALHRPPSGARLLGITVAILSTLAGCAKELPPTPYVANPDPKEPYNVTLTLLNAPDDLKLSSAYAQYRIENTGCMAPIKNFAGIRREPVTHDLDIPLRRVDANTYVGTYFHDGMLEKDYYGRGPCRWALALVGASMNTERTKSFTYFPIGTTPARGRTAYFAEKNIRRVRDDGEKYPAVGVSEIQFALKIPEAKRSDYFFYSLAIETIATRSSATATQRTEQP